jgi:hypothetical protein
MDVDMTALVNPDFLSGGTQYPATGADAEACGASPTTTVMVGFTPYNEACRGQTMVPFETWAWDHEAEHMTNAVDYISDNRRWDARNVLEDLVNASGPLLEADVADRLQDLPLCVQRAAATHGYLGTFPGLPTATWFWGATPGAFYQRQQGDQWWPVGDDPFASPCNQP